MRVDHMSFRDLVDMVTQRGFPRKEGLEPLPDNAQAAGGSASGSRRMLQHATVA
jgi:hypothetical protein